MPRLSLRVRTSLPPYAKSDPDPSEPQHASNDTVSSICTSALASKLQPQSSIDEGQSEQDPCDPHMRMSDDGPFTLLTEGQVLQDASYGDEPDHREGDEADDRMCTVDLQHLSQHMLLAGRLSLLMQEQVRLTS